MQCSRSHVNNARNKTGVAREDETVQTGEIRKNIGKIREHILAGITLTIANMDSGRRMSPTLSPEP